MSQIFASFLPLDEGWEGEVYSDEVSDSGRIGRDGSLFIEDGSPTWSAEMPEYWSNPESLQTNKDPFRCLLCRYRIKIDELYYTGMLETRKRNAKKIKKNHNETK